MQRDERCVCVCVKHLSRLPLNITAVSEYSGVGRRDVSVFGLLISLSVFVYFQWENTVFPPTCHVLVAALRTRK